MVTAVATPTRDELRRDLTATPATLTRGVGGAILLQTSRFAFLGALMLGGVGDYTRTRCRREPCSF